MYHFYVSMQGESQDPFVHMAGFIIGIFLAFFGSALLLTKNREHDYVDGRTIMQRGQPENPSEIFRRNFYYSINERHLPYAPFSNEKNDDVRKRE